MDSATTHKALVARDATALSLGWILAISLVGAVSVFICVGFALAWRIKRGPPIARKLPVATQVGVHDGIMEASGVQVSPTRLAKRKIIASESKMSLSASTGGLSTRWPSVMSFNAPAVASLPPLPNTSTFRIFNLMRGKTHRSQSAMNNQHEEEEYNNNNNSYDQREQEMEEEKKPKRLSTRLSMSGWVLRDSWFGGAPAASRDSKAKAMEEGISADEFFAKQPTVVPVEPELAHVPMDLDEVQQQAFKQYWQQQAAEIQQEYAQRRISQSAAPRPLSVTESGLRDILRSTEQRLRDRSQSPTKMTPRNSLMRPVSLRTPRSLRNSSNPNRISNSHLANNKNGSMPELTNANWAPHVDSTSSVGSAANSLLAEAIEELQLPGGASSPSRLRGREWEPTENGQVAQQLAPASPQRSNSQRSNSRSPQRSPTRRRSTDSNASSSLSTLYSEPEDEDDDAALTSDDDPFVEKRLTFSPNGPRPITSSSDTMIKAAARYALHAPQHHQLRPNSDGQHRRDNALIALDKSALCLQPPQVRQSEEVRPKCNDFIQIFEDPSTDKLADSPSSLYEEEESFVSVSVDSASDVSGPSTPKSLEMTLEATPKEIAAATAAGRRSRSPTASPMPASAVEDEDEMDSNASSSPYSERDILSMLLASASPKRSLPAPPTITGPDGTVTAVLSPPPQAAMQRKPSDASSYYSEAPGSIQGSNYAQQSASTSGNGPVRKNTHRKNVSSVSCMVAELRRMDSMRSSYSTGSIQSVASNESSATAKGHRNYFNMGSDTKSNPNSAAAASAAAAPSRPQGARRQPPGASKLRHEDDFYGKENQGLGITRPGLTRSESTGLREDHSAPNLAIESPRESPKPTTAAQAQAARSTAPSPTRPKGPKPKHQTVEELARQERRRTKRDSMVISGKSGFVLAPTMAQMRM